MIEKLDFYEIPCPACRPLNQIDNPVLLGLRPSSACVLTSVAGGLANPALYDLSGPPDFLQFDNGPERALAAAAEAVKIAYAGNARALSEFLNVPDAEDLLRYVGRGNSTNFVQYMAVRELMRSCERALYNVRDLASGKDWRENIDPRESYVYRDGSVRLIERSTRDPGEIRDTFLALVNEKSLVDNIITFLIAATIDGHQVLLMGADENGALVGDSYGVPRGPARAGFRELNAPGAIHGAVYRLGWPDLAELLALSRVHVLRFKPKSSQSEVGNEIL